MSVCKYPWLLRAGVRLEALAAILLAGAGSVAAQGPALQDGDLLVGASQPITGLGIIARVRDGNAVTYGEPAGLLFYDPHEVMVDSLGRDRA